MKDLINSQDGDLRIYFIAIEYDCWDDECVCCSNRIHPKFQAIKIGKTKQRQLKKRLGDIQTGSPFPYTVLKVTQGTDELDKQLREEFSGDNMYGEWFKPTDRLLIRIAELPMYH